LNLLLDTQVALWVITDSSRLPPSIRQWLGEPGHCLWVSAVSVWEIGIKHSLARRGEGAMPVSARDALRFFKASGFSLLDVTPDHAAAVDSLPPFHADPFDRLLIAQALEEPLRFVTHDKALAAYAPSIIAC
jgi:PIN domain nuclease of toxin-antitoxin system